MSAGEVLLLVVSGTAAALLWGVWYTWALAARRPAVRGGGHRLAALGAPLAAGGLLFAVLRTMSSWDVRSDPFWTGFYLVLGAAWVAVALLWMPLAGFEPRGDLLERANPAAAVAWTGAVLALTAAFAGANVGDGPGWFVVVFCAALATWPLLALATALAAWARAAELVTVDRDVAAAFRFAAALVAAALVLGRSVAGDWHGAGAALRDHVRQAWPVLPAAIAAVAAERALARDPVRGGAWLPGLVYVAAAAAWVAALGAPT